MRAYSFQFNVELGNIEKNVEKVLKALGAIQEGALVVLPEMFMCGFDYPNMAKHAQRTWEVLDQISRISKEKSILVVGTYPTLEEGKLYNTAIILLDGKIIGKRDKIKLFPIYNEHVYFNQGTQNLVFDTKYGKIGVAICFELRFCSIFEELRKNGAQIILIPSMWGARRSHHLKILTQARAVETQSYLILSNACGKTGDEEYAGSSSIVDPWGNIMAYTADEELLISADIDLKEVEKVRRYIPMF